MKLQNMKFKNNSITSKYCVPVDEKTKRLLDSLKREKRLDVNSMARDFFEVLIKQAQSVPE